MAPEHKYKNLTQFEMEISIKSFLSTIMLVLPMLIMYFALRFAPTPEEEEIEKLRKEIQERRSAKAKLKSDQGQKKLKDYRDKKRIES